MEKVGGIRRRSIYEKNKSFTNRIQRENSVFPEKNALSASIRKFVVGNSKKNDIYGGRTKNIPEGNMRKTAGTTRQSTTSTFQNWHFSDRPASPSLTCLTFPRYNLAEKGTVSAGSVALWQQKTPFLSSI